MGNATPRTPLGCKWEGKSPSKKVFMGKSYGNMGKSMKHGGLQLGKYGFS
jgi:hypothetical protein